MNSKDNSLQKSYPELCKEWHFEKNGELLPENIRPKSGKKVWWICDKGHEWQTKICTRTSQATGCPYCSGRYATKEDNLAVTFPEIAKEWYFKKNEELLPEHVRPQSGRKMWWKCKKGHEWQAVISDRSRGSNCPYCSGRKATTDSNLAILSPELAKQWHPTKNENLTPHDVKAKSKKKAWWVCSRGHEWEALIKNRANGAGCPFCSGRLAEKYKNLSIDRPDITKDWNYNRNGNLSPEDVTYGSKKKVWWLCKKGHEWQAQINNRSRGSGCPICANEKRLKNFCKK